MTVSDLTKDMSKLQTELNSIKMKESEAQEQIAYLTQQLEAERRDGSKSKVCIFNSAVRTFSMLHTAYLTQSIAINMRDTAKGG
jgi:septal ring factor EnvC (AmiA/AmiB activator)